MRLIPRQRNMLQALWRNGRLSRRELHQLTGIRPNTVGSDAAALLRAGLVRETGMTSLRNAGGAARGRPRVPLEIDPVTRHVLGVAIRPGHVEAIRLSLLGQPASAPVTRSADGASVLIDATRDLLAQHVNRRTLGVGLSTPGFVDPVHHAILFSAAMPTERGASLQAAYDAAGRLPVVLENDMHALAARWLLTHQATQREDVLLVYFEDNALGAAMLIEGRPNRGCVTGANELGHTRLPVQTEVCYCGHPGCLERICSTTFLRRHSAGGTLEERAAAYDGFDTAMALMIDLLATGFANAVNFTRVNRLVLVGQLLRHAAFAEAITGAVRRRLLAELASRVTIDHWHQAALRSSETAGWLALASLYYEGWSYFEGSIA